MSAHAFVQLLVFHAADNPNYETEVHSTLVLAHTLGLTEWAEQELELDKESSLSCLVGKPMGFYSILFHMTLDSGRTSDTPHCPGEYWTTVDVQGNYMVHHLTDQAEIPEDVAALYEKDAALIWTKNSNGTFQFT